MISKLNSTTGRLLVAALCVAATQAALWGLQRHTGLSAAEASLRFDPAGLPVKIGTWSGEDVELDPRIFTKVGAQKQVNRVYRGELGRQSSVHLATFSTAELLAPHPPEMCYAGDGWSILKDDWQRDVGGRRYRLMFVEQDGARAAVAYWFQLGADVASNRDELRPSFQKLRWQGKSWPPLVKVLIHIPVELSEESAKSIADDLGAGIYEWIQDNS